MNFWSLNPALGCYINLIQKFTTKQWDAYTGIFEGWSTYLDITTCGSLTEAL